MLQLFEKFRRQSFSKLMIMLYNMIRMLVLRVRFSNSTISLIQNIRPDTIIKNSKGTLQLAHSIFTRRGVSFRVEEGKLAIGTSFFNQGCSITAKKNIIIGDDCLFGPNVVVVDHDHDYSLTDPLYRGREYLMEDVVIGNNVIIGANSVILKGSRIGANSVIGAGTIVSGTIAPNTVYYNERKIGSKPIIYEE